MNGNAHGALNRIYKYCPRRSTTCGFYQNQFDRMLLLTRKQQGQWFIEVNLSQYLQSFACRHQDLVNLCEKKSVSQITRICFRMSCSRFLLFPRSWHITEFDLSSDFNRSNTTSATSVAGATQPSGAPYVTPGFCGVHVILSFVLCAVFWGDTIYHTLPHTSCNFLL